MKRLIKNYSVCFNFLLVAGILVLFSGCAREKGAVSFNNEKLRKQSWEIEHSKPSDSAINSPKKESEEVAVPASIGNRESVSEESAVSGNVVKEGKKSGKAAKTAKMSPVQKLMVKKLAKTLDPDQNLQANRGGLDQNLKLAIIFGIIGVILMLLPWPFSLIGVILLIIGLVFLLLWALNQ